MKGLTDTTVDNDKKKKKKKKRRYKNINSAQGWSE